MNCKEIQNEEASNIDRVAQMSTHSNAEKSFEIDRLASN